MLAYVIWWPFTNSYWWSIIGDLNYVKNILNNTSANNTVSSKPNIDFSIWGSIKEEKLTKFKKTALDNLHSSWVNIPHVTQHDEADISDLLELRLKLNKKHKVKKLSKVNVRKLDYVITKFLNNFF